MLHEPLIGSDEGEATVLQSYRTSDNRKPRGGFLRLYSPCHFVPFYAFQGGLRGVSTWCLSFRLC